MATTVRISEKARRILRELAEQNNTSAEGVLDEALEAFRRRKVLEEISADLAALHQDPQLRAEIESERAAWDSTLMDGLPAGEIWTDDGRVVWTKPDAPNGG